MAKNFQGPFVLRIFYVADTGEGFENHRMNFNVDIITGAGTPGLAFSAYTVQAKNGTPLALNTAVEALLMTLDGFFNTGVTIGPAELWKVTVTDLGGGEYSVVEDFWAAYTTTIAAGTAATATIANSQVIITMRTAEGGILRLDLLDTVVVPQAQQGPPFSFTEANVFTAYAVSSSSIILGKDTSYPLVAKGFFPGSNEALFKKRYRQT